MYGSQKRQMSN